MLEAVREGLIPESFRHRSYVAIYNELKELKEWELAKWDAPREGHDMQEKDLLQKAMQQKNMMVLYRDELVAPEYAGVPVAVENELVVLQRQTNPAPCAPGILPRWSRWTMCRS